MTVAVVLPTIRGRTKDLARCLQAYGRTAPHVHLYVEHGHGSCGAAWVSGAEKAVRDGFGYLHFTADDLEPHDGWLRIALETVDAGFIPAPVVMNPDGGLDSAGLEGFGQYRGAFEDWQLVHGTTVPFLSWEMWKAISEVDGFLEVMGRTHACTDLMVSVAGRKCGWETVIRPGMQFTHHVAAAGRNYNRYPADTQEYLAWVPTVR